MSHGMKVVVLVVMLSACAAESERDVASSAEALRTEERGRVAICHRMDDGAGPQTLVVAAAAVAAHLRHGDVVGECSTGCSASSCDDGDLCTTDACLPSGQCAHVAVDCNDANPCTSERCDPLQGCITQPVTAVTSCDDGNECTGQDKCVGSACRGTAIAGCCRGAQDCDDQNPCTTDACVNRACVVTDVNCTVPDACIVGFCDPAKGACGSVPVVCDDQNACTDDTCDGAIGCVHQARPGCGQVACCSTGTLTDCDNSGSGTRCHTGVLVDGSCAGSVARSLEVCNGIDDDCNGLVDELPGIGKDCTDFSVNTIGRCHAVYGCLSVVGQGPGGLSCIQDVYPVLETCNGVDDDCNGIVDDSTTDIGQPCCETGNLADCTNTGAGIACHTGMSVCTNGAQRCNGSVSRRQETCNNFDDDCNGVVDDAANACEQLTCCPFGSPAECENSGTGTRCHPGTPVNGACIGAVGRTIETCNGIDDDCNGIVDDVGGIGTACTSHDVNSGGSCRAVYLCLGVPGFGPAGLTCTQQVGPVPETCNGADDNCNGVVDDSPTDVGQPCCETGNLADCTNTGSGTMCRTGFVACSSGMRRCVGSIARRQETCNSLDDDCNGVIDDAANGCP